MAYLNAFSNLKKKCGAPYLFKCGFACVCKTDGSLCRLEVMALRTRSVRFFRLTMAMSMRRWTSGWDRASSGVTWYGSVLREDGNGELEEAVRKTDRRTDHLTPQIPFLTSWSRSGSQPG